MVVLIFDNAECILPLDRLSVAAWAMIISRAPTYACTLGSLSYVQAGRINELTVPVFPIAGNSASL